MEMLVRQLRRVALYGDSILKGIQLAPDTAKYRVENTVDFTVLEQKLGCKIDNCSRFGCTVTKGKQLIERALAAGKLGDVVVMDYGGNDCDFDWAAVSADPTAEHQPHTPLAQFLSTYREIIALLRAHCIEPILTTLPPLQPQWFFDWFCGGLNQQNILSWLGDVNTIYRYQENYSRAVERLAREERVKLVDLRGAFLSARRIDDLFCRDGIHPNAAGQQLIAETFLASV